MWMFSFHKWAKNRNLSCTMFYDSFPLRPLCFRVIGRPTDDFLNKTTKFYIYSNRPHPTSNKSDYHHQAAHKMTYYHKRAHKIFIQIAPLLLNKDITKFCIKWLKTPPSYFWKKRLLPQKTPHNDKNLYLFKTSPSYFNKTIPYFELIQNAPLPHQKKRLLPPRGP